MTSYRVWRHDSGMILVELELNRHYLVIDDPGWSPGLVNFLGKVFHTGNFPIISKASMTRLA